MATNRNEPTLNDATHPKSTGDAGPNMHKAPSMIWFIVPLLLLMAYGYFTR